MKTLRKQSTKARITILLVMAVGLISLKSQAQTTERVVSGIVKSYDEPVPFASIILKGTMIGVAADEHGKFVFPQKLRENDVLVVSSLAYEDQEFTITGNTTYIEPNLETNPIIIVGALRSAPSESVRKSNRKL